MRTPDPPKKKDILGYFGSPRVSTRVFVGSPKGVNASMGLTLAAGDNGALVGIGRGAFGGISPQIGPFWGEVEGFSPKICPLGWCRDFTPKFVRWGNVKGFSCKNGRFGVVSRVFHPKLVHFW